MQILTIITSIILFVALVVITWNRLSQFDAKAKIKICTIGIIICLIITILIFQIASIGIEYVNSNSKGAVMQVITLLFTPINGIVCLPYLAKILDKVKSGEMKKEEAKKKLIVFTILVVLIIVIEIFYFKDIQNGIMEYANKIKK